MWSCQRLLLLRRPEGTVNCHANHHDTHTHKLSFNPRALQLLNLGRECSDDVEQAAAAAHCVQK
jgi:hypothetical protein